MLKPRVDILLEEYEKLKECERENQRLKENNQENKKLQKQLEAYENMRKEAIEYLKEKQNVPEWWDTDFLYLLNILNKVGDDNE